MMELLPTDEAHHIRWPSVKTWDEKFYGQILGQTFANREIFVRDCLKYNKIKNSFGQPNFAHQNLIQGPIYLKNLNNEQSN
jgi:hypothetical protein